MIVKHDQSINTLAVVANACEATRLIMVNIMGNDISDSVQGIEINQEVSYSMTLAAIQNHITSRVGV